MRKLLVIPALALIMGTQAQAGTLLEPYVGFNLLGSASSSNGTTDTSEDFSGLGFGARAAYTMENLFVGLDFRLAYLGGTAEGTGSDFDFTNTQLGAVVGASISVLRVWGGVNFINSFEETTSGVASPFTAKGLGFKIGAGYEVAPMISINAEYQINPTSETCNAADVCTDIDASNPDATASNNMLFLSVSVPITI